MQELAYPSSRADSTTEALKLPPHSIEAEQAVLGGLMIDNGTWDQVADLVIEEDFYRKDHRLIFRAIAMLAEELDIPIHMHVHETADEVQHAVAKHGNRPLQRLDQLGLLSPRLLAVHMTQLNKNEINRCAETGVNVVHCPESNLKLASGFCPAAGLAGAGINIALGTDGAASNNDLDMLGEMRTAALLGKAVSGDASALPAHTVLRMATLNGASALGIGHETGSLTAGKWADITAVRMDSLEAQPVYDPVSHLVYACGREQVSDVWVAGQHLLKERRLTTLDDHEILNRVRLWQERIGTANRTGHAQP